jgi:hypothetical protein
MKKKKKIYIVLGMHRSGTSVFTRSLKIYNLNYGKDLAKARKDNPKGFFEDEDFFKINHKNLNNLSIFWHTIINPNIIKNIKKKFFNKEIKNFKKKLIEQKINVLKDPRSALLIQFWENNLKDFDIKYIFCFRNPEQIIRSLKIRDKFSNKKIYFMILQYWYLILKKAYNKKMIFINYNNYVKNIERESRKISHKLKLQINKVEQKKFKNDFLIKKKIYKKPIKIKEKLLDICFKKFSKNKISNSEIRILLNKLNQTFSSKEYINLEKNDLKKREIFFGKQNFLYKFKKKLLVS